MKKVFWINPIIFTAILLLVACKKEETSGDIEYKVTHWPAVTTLEVTNLTDTTATLNGTVNAFGLSTTVIFEYDTTTSYGNTVTASQSPVKVDGITNVSADISGLDSCSIYHFRIKAENSLWTDFYGAEKIFNTNTYVTDVDGNVYNTVKIGTQVWMAENLKTTKYSNGDLIGTTDPATLDINSELTPKYQWAYDGNEGNVATYGRLYTWYSVTDSRNVCPTGWHIPTDGEWTTLYYFLGTYGADKLKETGTSHWPSPNAGATNETGFTAIPSGCRGGGGEFNLIGKWLFWWSSTEYTPRRLPLSAYTTQIYYDIGSFMRQERELQAGLSVRCLRD